MQDSQEWFIADFSQTDDGQGCSFEVIDPELADALENMDNSDSDVTAMVLHDDGSVQATNSVEEAVAIADPTSYSLDSDGQLQSRSVVNDSPEDYLIVAINAGHGGNDPGATANGLKEKDLTLSIARAMEDELNTYTGVSAYMVRDSDETIDSLQTRVDRAKNVGADVYVSIHINAGGGTGAEVWVPNNSSYNNETHTVGVELGGKIANELEKLGLQLRGNTEGWDGVKTKSTVYDKYPDGSLQDWYGDIRNARNAGIPGMIVEHAFIDNSSDAAKLAQTSFQKQLGQADAKGVAQYYKLAKDSEARAASLVSVKSHVSKLGWENEVYDGKVSGTTGKGLSLEAFQLNLQNEADAEGGISYSAFVNGAWQNSVSDGGTAGTTGAGTAVQAIRIQLTGAAADKYDVYYRTHSAKIGWLDWAKNGENAGTIGYGYDVQAIEVVVVDKDSSAPGATGRPSMELSPESSLISYSTHVQSLGWQDPVNGGFTSGTVGQAKRLEAIKISLASGEYSGSVQYRTHIQSYGWESDWKSDGEVSGTSGEGKRLEAIQIQLTGEMAEHYDIYYRVQAQKLGWMDWAKNGESAGTAGYGYRLEAIEIQLVPKNEAAPGPTDNAFQEIVVEKTPIMGISLTTVDQMVYYYNSTGHKYPASVYASKGAPTIRAFCQIVYEEASVEGVRAEVLFCQAMKETGWLQFGGSVKANQCNFGGLGAVNSTAPGATFKDVREGLRAQTQHLKAYASKDSLVNDCVDPRFDLITRGIAPNLEDLNGRWAVPGTTYGQDLRAMIERLFVF